MPHPHHLIRLRGPWECRPLASDSPLAGESWRAETIGLPPPGQAVIPADWGATLDADFRGRVAYRRRFGRPTGLGAGDRVELVIDRVEAFGRVGLNGEALGAIPLGGQAWRCDITARLRPRNELIIEVERPPVADGGSAIFRPGPEGLPGGLVGEVRLEIFVV